MALPPLPPRAPSNAAFMAAIPDPVVEVVAAPRRTGELEVWMIPVAVKLLSDAMPVKMVADALGVSKRKFDTWLEAGQAEGCTDSLLVQFATQCVEARMKGRSSVWQMMKDHALESDKAAIALAKASDPETWNPPKEMKVENTHEVVPTATEDLSGMTLEQKLQYRALKKLARGGQ
jgi:hypothetical protein